MQSSRPDPAMQVYCMPASSPAATASASTIRGAILEPPGAAVSLYRPERFRDDCLLPGAHVKAGTPGPAGPGSDVQRGDRALPFGLP